MNIINQVNGMLNTLDSWVEPTGIQVELDLPQNHHRLLVTFNPQKDKYLHFITHSRVNTSYDLDLWITDLEGNVLEERKLLDYMRENSEQLAHITNIFDLHAVSFLYPTVTENLT